MKLLLIGKNGQVGTALQQSLAPLGELVALDRVACDLAQAADCLWLQDYVRRTRPQVIINASAYTAVDRAESETALADQINHRALAQLAQAAAQVRAWLIHYSTDYVFDGRQATGYKENDSTAPLNVYGRTKRDGELAALLHAPNTLIVRTCWVFSATGSNFLKTILRLAQTREQLAIVADQYGTPTSADLIARVTAQMISRLGGPPPSTAVHPLAGIYHLSASGHTNWHAYACYVLERALALGWSLRVQPQWVQAIASSDYPTPAARPGYSLLNCDKLCHTFDIRLPDWREGVDAVVAQLEPQKSSAA